MTQLETIDRRHAAVDAGDAQAAGALCVDRVEVGGPRGSALARLGLGAADEVTARR